MADIHRVVLKIGTSVLLGEDGRICKARAEDFARQIKAVRDRSVDVIVVSSGAIACGMETVGLKRKPKDMARKQALASVGQIVLMAMYMDAFAAVGLTASQILLTHEDTKSRSRCLNLMNTIDTLLAMGVVPIVNENDTLSFKEIMFGDNDNLSALIAQIGNADLLVLLSDVEGLYEKDPKQHPGTAMITTVKKIDEHIEALAHGTTSEKSVGGMTSKLEAAREGGELRHTHQGCRGRREGCRAETGRRRGDRHPLYGEEVPDKEEMLDRFRVQAEGENRDRPGRAGRPPSPREKSPAFRHRRGGG